MSMPKAEHLPIHLLLQERHYAGTVTVPGAASPAAVAAVPAIGRTLAWAVGTADLLPGRCQVVAAVDNLADRAADIPAGRVAVGTVAGIAAVAADSAAWLPGSRYPLTRLQWGYRVLPGLWKLQPE